jgi:hypothetical protein
MYPSHIPQHGRYPNSQEDYLYFTPYQAEDYYPELIDERLHGGPPPFAPPGHGPGAGPPSFAPPGHGPSAGPPTSPPPSFVPTQTQQAGVQPFAVDPGSIRRCLFRYTYIWLRGFQQFWFYPTHVGRNSVSGWRWIGFRWVYMGISLRQIQQFTCV